MEKTIQTYNCRLFHTKWLLMSKKLILSIFIKMYFSLAYNPDNDTEPAVCESDSHLTGFFSTYLLFVVRLSCYLPFLHTVFFRRTTWFLGKSKFVYTGFVYKENNMERCPTVLNSNKPKSLLMYIYVASQNKKYIKKTFIDLKNLFKTY